MQRAAQQSWTQENLVLEVRYWVLAVLDPGEPCVGGEVVGLSPFSLLHARVLLSRLVMH